MRPPSRETRLIFLPTLLPLCYKKLCRCWLGMLHDWVWLMNQICHTTRLQNVRSLLNIWIFLVVFRLLSWGKLVWDGWLDSQSHVTWTLGVCTAHFPDFPTFLDIPVFHSSRQYFLLLLSCLKHLNFSLSWWLFSKSWSTTRWGFNTIRAVSFSVFICKSSWRFAESCFCPPRSCFSCDLDQSFGPF